LCTLSPPLSSSSPLTGNTLSPSSLFYFSSSPRTEPPLHLLPLPPFPSPSRRTFPTPPPLCATTPEARNRRPVRHLREGGAGRAGLLSSPASSAEPPRRRPRREESSTATPGTGDDEI
ncbi:hypothetical protein Tsubulata_031503, partial [Turnera subulata]